MCLGNGENDRRHPDHAADAEVGDAGVQREACAKADDERRHGRLHQREEVDLTQEVADEEDAVEDEEDEQRGELRTRSPPQGTCVDAAERRAGASVGALIDGCRSDGRPD